MHSLIALAFAAQFAILPPNPYGDEQKAPPDIPKQYLNPNSHCTINGVGVDCGYKKMLKLRGGDPSLSGGPSGDGPGADGSDGSDGGAGSDGGSGGP